MPTTEMNRRQGVNSNKAIKIPVKATSGNPITLQGEQIIDGVSCLWGSRVLVRGQTDQKTNGIYDVSTSAWTRAVDFDGHYDITRGTIVYVLEGATYGGTWWQITTDNPVIGTSNLTFAQTFVGDSDVLEFQQSGTGAVVRDAQSKMREIFSVADFGAVGDGTTDDTVSIQAAITQAAALGGGEIRFGQGVYIVSSTLTITDDSIVLRGSGGVGNTNAANWRQFAATTLRWNGAAGGTVISISTPVSALRTSTLQACGIKDMLIDCELVAGGSYADIGVEILGLRGGKFENLTIYRSASKGFNLDIMADTSNLTGGELGDVQRCVFINCMVACNNVAGNSHGFVLGDTNTGVATGNVSLNSFHHCEALTYNGTGFKLHGCDSNAFMFTRAYVNPAGTGYGVEFYGGAVTNKHARSNIFHGYFGNGPVRAVTGVVQANDNFFFGYSEENAPGKPTEISGFPIYYFTDGGEGRLKFLDLNGSTAYVKVSGSGPSIQLVETDVTANNQRWSINPAAEDLIIQALTDAGGGGAKRIVLTRTAQAIDSMNLEGGTNLSVTGSATVTGSLSVSGKMTFGQFRAMTTGVVTGYVEVTDAAGTKRYMACLGNIGELSGIGASTSTVVGAALGAMAAYSAGVADARMVGTTA